MHPLFKKADELSRLAIGAAIEVHRLTGPGPGPLWLACWIGLCALKAAAVEDGAIILPPSTPDPIEPFNRVMWSVNQGLMKGAVQPTATIYRRVVIKPVRRGLHNMGANLLFPDHLANTSSVMIPATGRRLKFSYWLQRKPAPVAYILPGLGSHRLGEASLALAELMFKNGFSAVSISSPFNFEFMNEAAAAAMPGYTPQDAADARVALTEIDRWLRARYRSRLERPALVGYSLGGFEGLFIAAQTNHHDLIQFDRVVAINPPVRLMYGLEKLDEYYRAPLAWPAAQRTDRIRNTLVKAAALSQAPLQPNGPLPFDESEAEFLIGLTFRFALRDVIFTSQRRYNIGRLTQPLRRMRREPAYQEILRYSYLDYYHDFAVPYYKTRGIDLTGGAWHEAGDLRSNSSALQANPAVRLIVNRDDFLITAEDLDWMERTFSGKRLTLFAHGGHLGNLIQPAMQKAILEALAGLRSGPAVSLQLLTIRKGSPGQSIAPLVP